MNKKKSGSIALSFILTVLMTVMGLSVSVPAEGLTGAEYQVQKNDSLYKIAGTQLGSGDRWAKIFELNKAGIKDPSLIYAGQILTLPASGQDLSGAGSITADNAPAAEQNVLDEQQEADKYAKQRYDAAQKEEPGVTAVLKVSLRITGQRRIRLIRG